MRQAQHQQQQRLQNVPAEQARVRDERLSHIDTALAELETAQLQMQRHIAEPLGADSPLLVQASFRMRTATRGVEPQAPGAGQPTTGSGFRVVGGCGRDVSNQRSQPLPAREVTLQAVTAVLQQSAIGTLQKVCIGNNTGWAFRLPAADYCAATAEGFSWLQAGGGAPSTQEHILATHIALAVRTADIEVLDRLLARSKSDNAATLQRALRHRGALGASVLHAAAALGQADRILLLCKAGVDPLQADDFGQTAAHLCARNGALAA